ncbi:tetratricopeptide repeat protein 31 isoform X2 [Hippocampus zosterae]|uniref:tetratricopeptide repeat protein 31 isoform X1 n=1 Tax=Hippocampus zosterae TaxID=109293 RepID=UPI00223D10AA|nr:tetratricopeptide repeat protein 31 isoform X1 [Hippocampus zosterae]XP_051935339.1 tetratricopeptide repeat protein 31 isoform X2 [Hippocampus zosterae]
MVALMKITRDICRLLGLASGPPPQQQEQSLDCGAASPDDAGALSQDALNGDEDLSEEEKVRRRAERRRAKRKRRRKRKKPEQVKQSDKDEEAEDGAAGDSALDDSDSEVEAHVGGQTHLQKADKKHAKPAASHKLTTSKATAPSRERQKATSPEEEQEWDVSSAFFANAASHIKPKGTCRKSKENKENEARKETKVTDITTKKSTSLAEKGIKLVQEGQYSQAARMFTEAIKCDPNDYRFFGNRSYCYYCLEQYSEGLADAEHSIQLAPEWPKGHFRKGSSLMGMQRYSEAEKAMEQVLKLDKDCEEAVNELYNCKVLQLMEFGFEEVQCASLLEKFSTVQAVLSSYFDAAGATSQDQSLVQQGPCPSLWVGNVTTELTEKDLRDLFKMYGEIESIRVLYERFCAFVNFRNASDAARAMDRLNGYFIENTRLVVRYPDRRPHRVLPTPLSVTQQVAAAAGPRRRGPVNGDECYFWRTTGCHFGDKCRYKHIPDQKGNDRKPWLP